MTLHTVYVKLGANSAKSTIQKKNLKENWKQKTKQKKRLKTTVKSEFLHNRFYQTLAISVCLAVLGPSSNPSFASLLPVLIAAAGCFSTCPSCHAAGTCGGDGPTGPSRERAGWPCRPLHRFGHVSPHRLSPATGTSCLAWSWGTCMRRPWRAPTAAGRHVWCGARPACTPRWC